MEKNYSLLRSFDLEAAKRGDEICHRVSTRRLLFITHFSDKDTIVEQENGLRVICWNSHLLMAPLCWVEGKPVYKGDVLFRGLSPTCEVIVKELKNGYLYYERYDHCATPNSRVGITGSVSDLSWQKPKQKRDGWINIYPNGCPSRIYNTRLVAYQNRCEDFLDTVKVEWEE